MPAEAVRRRPRLVMETLLVLGVSLGKSAVYSILKLVDRLTYQVPLAQQRTTMNSSVASDRPWLDLAYQLANNLLPFCAAFLAIYLLGRSWPIGASPWRGIGLDRRQPARDLVWGIVIALVILGPALGFYLLARSLGLSTTIVMADLAEHWWTIPMYCLSAFQSGFLEEVLMIGYLTARWRQAGWHRVVAIVVNALIRGSYHLYQGFGGFISNMVFGFLLGWFYQKTRRLWPLIIAHTVIDVVAFVGYSLLAGRVSWL